MKAGVRISPRCMAIMPVLAAPSVAEIVKENRVTPDRLAPEAVYGEAASAC
jgi:predicted anti-sigma-YlaC factor YlaD